jgi:hypothetical protein
MAMWFSGTYNAVWSGTIGPTLTLSMIVRRG